MSYRVDFTPQALEDISKLDKGIAERVIKKIDWLSQNFQVINPQPLKAKFQGMYKLVIGDWRVIYTADFTNKGIEKMFSGKVSRIPRYRGYRGIVDTEVSRMPKHCRYHVGKGVRFCNAI